MLRKKLGLHLIRILNLGTLGMELRWLAFALPWKCRGCKQLSAAAVAAAEADEQLKQAVAPLGEEKEGVVVAVPSLLQPFQAQGQAGKFGPVKGVPSVQVTCLPALQSVTLPLGSALALDLQGVRQRRWTQFCHHLLGSPDQQLSPPSPSQQVCR